MLRRPIRRSLSRTSTLTPPSTTAGSSTGPGTVAKPSAVSGGRRGSSTQDGEGDDEAMFSLCGEKADGRKKFEFKMLVEIEGAVYRKTEDSANRIRSYSLTVLS